MTIMTILHGQSAQDFSFFDGKPKTHQKVETLNTVRKFNEAKFTVHLLLDTYSKFISSQDGSRCGFYPTCSGYCRRAIRKNGLVLGGIQACDRFTRCNGLSPEKYKVDIKRVKMIDHVP